MIIVSQLRVIDIDSQLGVIDIETQCEPHRQSRQTLRDRETQRDICMYRSDAKEATMLRYALIHQEMLVEVEEVVERDLRSEDVVEIHILLICSSVFAV